jgi:hypothetical protein
LICDLQGAFNRQRKLLELTDPVIHYYDPSKDNRKAVYGRTDRGDKGISGAFAILHVILHNYCDYMIGVYETAYRSGLTHSQPPRLSTKPRLQWSM